jgi:amino acid adenylation domain-containing protein
MAMKLSVTATTSGADSFPDACCHRLFERQAARTPDAVAVVRGTRRLSYRELNEYANRVARFLQRQELAREELIGVALRRSPSLLAVLLGIWKAGCAYVPLDPVYPEERLAFMIRDTGMRLLFADADVPAWDAVGDGKGRVLQLDAVADSIARENGGDVEGTVVPRDLAYVMYTSGSTGQPKGAMITHAGLANYLCWAVDAYGVEAGASVPMHSSLSFDLTVTSLYVPLLAGAHVELLDDADGVQALAEALRAGRRGLVKLTPAHLDLLNQELRPLELAGAADVLVIGGENLTAERVANWREHAPQTRLINEYGPTETVVGCCIHEIRAGEAAGGSIPIGRPIANMRLHVLDEQLRPLPPGVAGELCIGGPGVARGYLNRPQLTDERFIPDTFSGEPGARLYRTGDIGRQREDGILEYLGRADDQVKIRSYRVELGEIEQALAGHPEVRICAAVAYDDGPQKDLAVFAVLRRRGGMPASQLFDYLRLRLPAFMLPGRCVVLDALPLNLNGKADRAALRAMAALAPRALAAVAPAQPTPRTPTERKVMESFCEVFPAQNIGIFDNFFDLGGSSMSAVRLMSALRATTGTDVPLRNLYENPTVAGLAETIDALSWSADAAAIPGDAGVERMRISL